jgi:hypothetical protein
MRSFSLSIILSGLIICLNACKKNIPGNNLLLLKYIEIDTTAIAGKDTVFVYSYDYDENNRLESIDVRAFEYNMSMTGWRIRHHRAGSFSYNGSDKIPFKFTGVYESIGYLPDVPITSQVNNIFLYDINNRIVVDSSHSLPDNFPENSSSDRYIYSGNNIFFTHKSYMPPGSVSFTTTKKTYNHYGNGNIILEKDTVTYMNYLNAINHVNEISRSASFDTYKNPWSDLLTAFNTNFYIHGDGLIGWNGPGIFNTTNINNPLHYSSVLRILAGSIGDIIPYTIDFSYSYSHLNYPLVVNIRIMYGQSVYYHKGYFIYNQ